MLDTDVTFGEVFRVHLAVLPGRSRVALLYAVAAADGGKNLAVPGGDPGLNDRPRLPFHNIGLPETQAA